MNLHEKTKAPTVGAAGALKKSQLPRKFSDKSTATEAQLSRIIAALRTSPKTTADLRALGCYQVSARIWSLRAKGYNIVTELFDGYAEDGMHHAKLGRYTLLAEPECAAAPAPARDPAFAVSDGQWSQ